ETAVGWSLDPTGNEPRHTVSPPNTGPADGPAEWLRLPSRAAWSARGTGGRCRARRLPPCAATAGGHPHGPSRTIPDQAPLPAVSGGHRHCGEARRIDFVGRQRAAPSPSAHLHGGGAMNPERIELASPSLSDAFRSTLGKLGAQHAQRVLNVLLE